MAAAAAAATRKRAGADGGFCPAAAGEKRPRYGQYEFGSNYEALELLGEGPCGVLVKARDHRTGETVAIKWIRPDDACYGGGGARGLLRWAGTLAARRVGHHPSIAQIKCAAADEASGDVFVVMEFVGPTLRSRLTRRFSEAETRAVTRELLGAVQGLHGSGAVHRDVRPDNILVGAGGALKLCDLGTARPSGTPFPEEEGVGALRYRAPELLMGFRTYGPTVDVWAVGCVMAELLAGAPLFGGAETEHDVFAKVLELRYEMELPEFRAFEGLPELSEAGREVLCGLLTFQPDLRLTAAEALRHRWLAVEADDAFLCATLCTQLDRLSFITSM